MLLLRNYLTIEFNILTEQPLSSRAIDSNNTFHEIQKDYRTIKLKYNKINIYLVYSKIAIIHWQALVRGGQDSRDKQSLSIKA